MKTVLLTNTAEEGEAYAKLAALQPHEFIVVTPSNGTMLRGIRLSNADLIAEFPGFREHPKSHEAIQILTSSMRLSDTKPAWRKIGT